MYFQITGVRRQVLISICLYIGAIHYGFMGSWPGPVLPKLRDLEQSPFPYLLTEAQLALVGSFAYLGAIPGPYITTWLSNTRGRKPSLIVSAVFAVLGYTIMATTNSLTMLYVGRFFESMSFGSSAVATFVYLGEIASPKIRGILLSAIGSMFTLGSILIFATGPYISYYGTIYISLALSILQVIALLWIPESPIFYIIKGQDQNVIKVLKDLGRSQDAEKMLKMREKNIDTSTLKDWKELFVVKSNRKALFIVLVLNVLQHGSGVMAMIFFSAAIFEMAGSSIKSNFAMLIVAFSQLMGSLVTPFFIESTGRKKMLIISSSVCCLSMFILGLYFYLNHVGNPIVNKITWIPLVMLILFYIGYDSGFGIIPNALMGEMFTSNVRTNGSTLTMSSSWSFGFAVATAFGALLETVGGHVLFWFFSCICACAVLFTILFVPETKGKTLLEIQETM